ncbi:hypothetical protein JVU11DRAFT_11451 [Chiua virens]|nr:hypothetical protein JVU11DRAFT_11451 [Chiua virens]
MQTSSSSNPKQFICNCNRYCRGQLHLISEATFYRHFAYAEERERDMLEEIKTAGSFDAAHAILANTTLFNKRTQNLPKQPDNQAASGPSSRPASVSARRAETIRGLAKRAHEASEPNPRLWRRKCSCNKENVDPNVRQPERPNREQVSPPPERFSPPPDPQLSPP